MKSQFFRLWILSLVGLSMGAGAFAQFSGGTGTAANPFLIKTANDLNNVRNYLGDSHADKHFRLMNDIDLTAFLSNYDEGWLPIGSFSFPNNNSFNGYFYGSGYEIKGLWINSPLQRVGLFGMSRGRIDSLSVAISTKGIEGQHLVGGLIGDNEGTVSYCYVSGGACQASQTSNYYVASCYCGGLIGLNTGQVENCYASVNIFSTTNSTEPSVSYSYAGGLIGVNGGIITNSCSTGNVSSIAFSTKHSTSCSGGLVGQNGGIITNCYSIGNVSSSASSPSTTFSCSGGFVGYLFKYENGLGEISNCYAIGQVISSNYSGAFAGYCLDDNSLFHCYYNFDVNGQLSAVGNNIGNHDVYGVNTVRMKSKATFTNWNFDKIWIMEEGISYPYLYNIPNYVEGLTSVCSNSTHTYATYANKSNYAWTVTNGYILSGQSTNKITVKWNNNTNQGKVSVTYNNTEQVSREINLSPIPAPSIINERNTFASTEYIYSTESGKNNYIWTINGGEILSGLGTNKIIVQWKEKTGKLSVNYANGGCMADNPTEISYQFEKGTGTATDPYQITNAEQLNNIRLFPDLYYCLANNIDLTDYLKTTAAGWNPLPDFSGSFDGRFFKIKGLWINQPNGDELGLFASNSGTIKNLYVEIASKGIYGNDYVGGLVAVNYGAITQCGVKEGNLTSKGTDVGGLVGLNYGTVSQCYSANTVIWGSEGVGGLLGCTRGVNAKIQQCYAINTVVGSQYVGGLIGDMYDATISQSYSASVVEGGNYTGGFLGYCSNGIITGCYYDAYNSCQSQGLGHNDPQANNIRARQPHEMLSRSTFLGWDFNNVWINTDGENYPYFRWQNIAPTPPPLSVGQVQGGKKGLSVYPNPVSDMAYIKCIPQSPVVIYNSQGKLLHQFTPEQEETGVDMSAYPNGVYVFRSDNQTVKVIKR